jgi:hypothetical protein
MMNFEDCLEELSFQIDKEMILTTVETTNVESFEVIINGETMSLDNNIRISEGDEITVKITRDILYSQADITLVGYDPNVAFDNENIAESSLDEPIDEEHIMINYDEN